MIFLRIISSIFQFYLLQVHPWKKIVRGNTEVEETTTCFMCLMQVKKTKFEKHMSKFHAATCTKDKLEEMCRETEENQATEALNFDEIIEEEMGRQEMLKKRRTAGLRGMLRKKQEPEQGDINTNSLKSFLCQGNWTGTNIEELRKHLEKDHKVVFQIKELIELSKPEELEPASPTEEEEQLLAVTSVDTNSGEKMGENILWWVIIISQGQPENLKPSTATDEVEAGLLTVSSETRVDINSGEENIVQYFNVDDNSNDSSGQSGNTE